MQKIISRNLGYAMSLVIIACTFNLAPLHGMIPLLKVKQEETECFIIHYWPKAEGVDQQFEIYPQKCTAEDSGRMDLLKAVECGDPQKVKTLIAQGIDPRRRFHVSIELDVSDLITKDEQNKVWTRPEYCKKNSQITLLQVAAAHCKSPEVVQVLLDAGVEVNYVCTDEMHYPSALMLAAECPNYVPESANVHAIMEILLKRNADANVEDNIATITAGRALVGDKECVALLLKDDALRCKKIACHVPALTHVLQSTVREIRDVYPTKFKNQEELDLHKADSRYLYPAFSALACRALIGDAHGVAMLLKAGAQPNQVVCFKMNKETPMEMKTVLDAVVCKIDALQRRPAMQLVTKLVRPGVDGVNTMEFGEVAPYIASLKRVVSVLLEAGAKPDIKYINFGDTSFKGPKLFYVCPDLSTVKDPEVKKLLMAYASEE